jgi:hypothetical protein
MKFITLLLSVGLLGASCHAQVLTITGFGTGDFTVVNDFSANIAVTQTATTLTIVGNDQTSALAGTFAQFDMTGYMGGIDLAASVSGTNPGTHFTLTLYDSANNPAEFHGNLGSFSSAISVLTLSPGAVGVFMPTNVVAMVLSFGGAGSSLTMTLDALTVGAIPEPSTYAAIIGLLALGYVAYRRRQLAA